MSTYNIEALKTLYSQHWKPGWGSIANDEVLFVQSLIEKYQPKNFLEIGMASGLSGGIIASIMEDCGGESFSTIDYDNTFFGDSTKENGFLIEDIFSGSKVEVSKHPFTTSPDINKLNKTFEMAFIDANHQHPWPLIDTLCLFPFMTGKKIMIHHDLKLFKNQDVVYGIGPKYLFDQFDSSVRVVADANQGNIYSLTLESITKSEMETAAINAFSLPWSLRHPLAQEQVEKIAGVLTEHYSSTLADAFKKCVGKFNHLERLRTGV